MPLALSPAFKPEVEGLKRMLDGLEGVLEEFKRMLKVVERMVEVVERMVEVNERMVEVVERMVEVVEGVLKVVEVLEGWLERPGVEPGATSEESNGGKRQGRQLPPPAANELLKSQLFSSWDVL